MKKTLLYTLAIATLIGCQQDISNEGDNTPVESAKLSATFQSNNNETKAYLGSDYYYRWDAQDAISVFAEDGYNRKYQTTTGDVVLSQIEEVSKPDGAPELTTENTIYALFPYNEANAIKGADSETTLCGVLNTEQKHNTSNPSLNAAIMVASNDQNSDLLTFCNACALIKLNINVAADDADVATIQFIQIESKSKSLSGPVTIAVGTNDCTAVIDKTVVDENGYTIAQKMIKLTECNTEGKLGTAYQSFYIAIPAGTYEANDLSIGIYTDNDAFNYATNLKSSFTIGRSKFLELKTTLKDNFDWVEVDSESSTATVTDDATLVNTAFVTNPTNLGDMQGFANYDKIGTVIDTPTEDITIDGNNKTLTFAATDYDYMVINSFTTTQSGYKAITPPVVTVKDLTITGELCTTCMGIYVKNTGETKQKQFNTVATNLNVIDCKIIPYGSSGIGAAVCGYGTIVLNDCNITGTTRSEKDTNATKPIYDFAVTNNTTTTINGGKIGSIRAWEHCVMTIQGGAEITTIDWTGLGHYPERSLNINDASVTNLNIVPNHAFSPRVNINEGAVIDVLYIGGKTKTLDNIIIDEAATVNKVIYGEEEMTLEEFKTKYKS